MKLVLFDLDGTLISGNASVKFGLYMLRRGICSRTRLVAAIGLYGLFALGLCSFQRMQRGTFRLLFAGKPKAPFVHAAQEFCDGCFSQIARSDVAQELHAPNTTQAIFSSSPDFLVRPFAEKFGVSHYFGSKYEVDSYGNFHKVVPLNKTAVVELLSYDTLVVYSDSIADLELLKKADVPVAVSPDKALLQYARKHNWRVM